MPSAPSTSCAAKPMSMKGTRADGSATIEGRMRVAPPVAAFAFAEGSALQQGVQMKARRAPAGIWRGLPLNCRATGKEVRSLQSGLIAYLDSVKSRDPAAHSRWDVLFYPGVIALALHR